MSIDIGKVDPKSVHCPSCFSVPGVPCTVNGWAFGLGGTHRSRVRSAYTRAYSKKWRERDRKENGYRVFLG